MKRLAVFLGAVILVALVLGSFNPVEGPKLVEAQAKPTLHWGSGGYDVRLVQWKLQSWGYYRGSIDGVFGTETS